MEDQDMKYFRDLLNSLLEDLLKQGNDTVNILVDSTVKAIDPVDQASMETDRNFRLRLRDRENRLINKIRQSLERLESGTYSICETCGEEISILRLKARPVTTLCISCKNKMETLEKAMGQ